MSPRSIVLLSAVAVACAPAPRIGLPAPNPNGCYVQIFEQPEFRGAGDVLNGPGRWPTLDRIGQTTEESWRDRIRALRVGSRATLTVHTEASFAGESQRFGPDSAQPQLDARFAGRIESLDLACGP